MRSEAGPDYFFLIALSKDGANKSPGKIGEVRKLDTYELDYLAAGTYRPGMFVKEIYFPGAKDGLTKYKSFYLVSITYVPLESQDWQCWLGGG